MDKSQVLDRIRNRLTLPRVLFQKMRELEPMCQQAIDEIDGLIEEIKRTDETPHE